jgi:hypothetical protein
MKELPHKAAPLRLSVARRVNRLSGGSSFNRRHIVGVVVAAAMLIAGTMLMDTVSRAAGIMTALGSSAIAVILLAHFGVVAAVLALVLAWRRRTRR